MTARNYTPESLALEWGCSARHIRNLIADGRLRAWRLGGRLLRIPPEAVEEFVCQNTTASGGSGEDCASSTATAKESGDGTVSELLTRARLRALRQGSTPN